MPNNTNQIVPSKNSEILKQAQSGELTADEGFRELQSNPQSEQQGKPMKNSVKGKVLKILVYEGDMEQAKVCVAFPLGLAKWAGRLLPQFSKLMPFALDLASMASAKSEKFSTLIQGKYSDTDFAEILMTICDVIEEGIDQLEEIGRFDFVTVQDGDSRVQICIE